MNAVDDFLNHLEAGCRETTLTPDMSVVVGVSGGLDSVALLHGLARLGFPLTVAHMNYGLRGKESDADERFVRKLASEKGFPVEVERVRLPSGNVQAEARRARYGFFEEVAVQADAEAIAVGHTEDDQVESVQLGLFREASPRAVTGMPVRRRQGRSVLVRPMLRICRKGIRAAAEEAGWTWREDSSNVSDDYLRNTLRHQDVPVFHSRGWIKLGDSVRKAFFEVGPPRDLQRFATWTVGGWALPVQDLAAFSKARRHGVYIEALRAWLPEAPRRESTCLELEDLLDAQPGRKKVWGRAKVVRDRERLAFLPEPLDWTPASLGKVKSVETPIGTLQVAVREREAGKEPFVQDAIRVDRSTLPSLAVRPWRTGDRIVLEHGSALLSDVLTDAHVPPSVKPVWPVVEGSDRIVWVPGIRKAAEMEERDASERVALVWRPNVV